MLGGFEVAVDGVPVAAEAWSRRQAAALVKVLALAPGRRLHREQVVEALWPDRAARCRRAAAAQGRALRPTRAAATRPVPCCCATRWSLLSAADDVRVDVDELGRAGRSALAEGTMRRSPPACSTRTTGGCCPTTSTSRGASARATTLRLLRLELLRLAERWEELLHEEPADEQAHLALIRASADAGRRTRRRSASSSGSSRRCGASSAPPRARRPTRSAPRSRLGCRTAPASRPASGDGSSAGAPSATRSAPSARRGRGGPGQAAWCSADTPGVGKSAVLELAEAVARAPRLAHRARGRRRRSRDRGRTRRCSRRWASCAASTPRCSTGWPTSTGPRSSEPSRGGTSPGPASPATSGCSSPPPS